MNTFKPGHKEKARCLSFFLILWFHVARAPPPGSCRYSVTQEHLLTLQKLIQNQLSNGCSIKYAFIERGQMSDICYIKAAVPQVLDLLKTHFEYVPKSDNNGYVTALENVIYNIFTHKCIPEIDEEEEDHPEKFMKEYSTLPQVALQKAHDVLSMYMALVMEGRGSIDWTCGEDYALDAPEPPTLHQDTAHCHCPSPSERPSTEIYPSAPNLEDQTLSHLTVKALERTSQPVHTMTATTAATLWSSQTIGTSNDNTDALDSK